MVPHRDAGRFGGAAKGALAYTELTEAHRMGRAAAGAAAHAELRYRATIEAMAEGEIEQVALSAGTLGAPAAVAVFSWVREKLDRPAEAG